MKKRYNNYDDDDNIFLAFLEGAAMGAITGMYIDAMFLDDDENDE